MFSEFRALGLGFRVVGPGLVWCLQGRRLMVRRDT